MRILLVKTSSLGDVIHNLPVASDIRRVFPQAEIDWVVEENFAELPRLHPAVRRVIPVAVRRWRKSLFSPAMWGEIREYRRLASTDFYAAAIDTQGLLKSALIAAQARGKRFGFSAAVAREPLAARFYDQCFAIPRNLHAVVRNRQLAAAALGYALDDLPLDYGIAASPLQADWLRSKVNEGDYAVLLTATSRADKEWPAGDWLALGKA
ncbi:MAG: lipopolysaccharide heptosyltransferase I, partial [Rhodocyclaceae bacterium]|nr:lipopolysaccharide heptosyltransferase I [Rhodocyclaceae bacterium]